MGTVPLEVLEGRLAGVAPLDVADGDLPGATRCGSLVA
jgi:hypothetical protein